MHKTHRRNAFSDMHPIVCLIYFAVMLGVVMTVMHPVIIGICTICAVLLVIRTRGVRGAAAWLIAAVCMAVLSALFNPLFNHRGVTVLFYGFGGNPITMEAIIYGAAAGAALAAVLIIFASFNVVMTDDKILYLFGALVPAFSLALTMTLRLVKVLGERMKLSAISQKRFYKTDTLPGKIRLGLAAINSTISYALESSLDISASMKSRGFGFTKRTFATDFRLTFRDIATSSVMLWLVAAMLFRFALGGAKSVYYPYISISGITDIPSVITWICYAVFGLLPMALIVSEDIKWKRSESST